jgi:histone H3
MESRSLRSGNKSIAIENEDLAKELGLSTETSVATSKTKIEPEDATKTTIRSKSKNAPKTKKSRQKLPRLGAIRKDGKRRRRKSGTVALREIRQLQKTTMLQIPRAAFVRLCREIASEYAMEDLRLSADGISALQEAAETYLTEGFKQAGESRAANIPTNVTLSVRHYRIATQRQEEEMLKARARCYKH